MVNVQVRLENSHDRQAVRAVNRAAFATPSEAKLVDALRKQARPTVSLVAIEDELVVGHIMFSPVYLAEHADFKIAGLAPMAVAPTHQNQGIGSALVQTGLVHCKQLNIAAVVVLGHPEYYPRFGFSPASKFHIETEYDVPDEAFMAIELMPNCFAGKAGKVKYHAAFDAV